MNYSILSRTGSLCLILLLSCRQEFTTYDKGLHYKIMSHHQGETAKQGETIKMHIRQVYHDSTWSDTRTRIPFYQVHDSSTLSPAAFHIFSKVRKGDSIVFKASTDSAFSGKMPGHVKKGDWLYTCIYILDILGPKQDFREDMKHEMNRINPLPDPASP